jgi:hypothetical protein
MTKTKQRQQLESDVDSVMRRIQAVSKRLKNDPDLGCAPGTGLHLFCWSYFAMATIDNPPPRGKVLEIREGWNQLAFKLTLAQAQAFAAALEAGFVDSYAAWLQSRDKGIVEGSTSHKRWLARRDRLQREIANMQAQLTEARERLASVLPAPMDD